ncbi:hypothetical protein ACSFA2_05940 [Variovorax sp. LT2P21]|uniref:hypothetical protein n=1 Tax=Variovorax sp. LT2P21 TaxID=3443731 RepID=UPI003F466EB6
MARVDFWTFGCINCRHALPDVREWHRKYKDQGLVVVGGRAHGFDYEKSINNGKHALKDLGIEVIQQLLEEARKESKPV